MGFLDTAGQFSTALGGLQFNVVSIANALSQMSAELANTSMRMKSLGVDFETVQERAIDLSNRFNLDVDAMSRLQTTAAYGFNNVETSIDRLNNMLAVSERLFGRNEKAAEGFVTSLGALSEGSKNYRNYLIAAVEQEGKLLNAGASENERAEKLRDIRGVTRDILNMEMLRGQISKDQYLQNLALISDSSKAESNVVKYNNALKEGERLLNAQRNIVLQMAGTEVSFNLAEIITLPQQAVGKLTAELHNIVKKGFGEGALGDALKSDDNKASLGKYVEGIAKVTSMSIAPNDAQKDEIISMHRGGTSAQDIAAQLSKDNPDEIATTAETVVRKGFETQGIKGDDLDDMVKAFKLSSEFQEVQEAVAHNQLAQLVSIISQEEQKNNLQNTLNKLTEQHLSTLTDIQRQRLLETTTNDEISKAVLVTSDYTK